MLSKGFKVTCIECDTGYADHVKNVSESAGFSVNISSSMNDIKESSDLNIIVSPEHKEKKMPGFYYEQLGIDNFDLKYDFIINDGIDRQRFLERFTKCTESIIILDNCEYAANCGRLMKSSAKPDLSAVYRDFLRSADWNRLVFEQPEGREGMGVADATGWESNHRWLTSVSWSRRHIFTDLIVSNIGFPLVNGQGIGNADLESLPERCPFDWETMTWSNDELYPSELDLKLDRRTV